MEKYINFFNDCADYYMKIAKNEFQRFHINRKVEHCKRVNKLAIEIAEKLNLTADEIYLISISSLFHDIGRFKQFYEYNTYVDIISCNHALLSIDMIEESNILNDLSDESRNIILDIIKIHNCKSIPDDVSKELYLYSSIIRDADKLDWIYAMVNIIPELSKENQSIFYSGKDDKEFVSDELVMAILNNKPVVKSELSTINELRLEAMGWIVTGMKNDVCYEIIKRENLIDKTFDLITDFKQKDKIYIYLMSKVK